MHKQFSTLFTDEQFWLEAISQAGMILVCSFIVMGIGTLVLALI